jgi:ABC-type bacteriocin/lantibiotic exporter with double-glycine peptidase domain
MKMINVPRFAQEGAKSCVPASVRMVLHYFGIALTEPELVKILESDVEGTSILNIELLPADTLGLELWTGEMSVDKLREYIDDDIPVIVAVWTDAFPYWLTNRPHAVVVVGYDEKSVYINDAKFPGATQAVQWNNFLIGWEDFGKFAAVIQKT